MIEQQTLDFGSLVDALVRTGSSPAVEDLEKVAETIAKLFEVDADEVAILQIDPKSKNLKFVIPSKLSTVGSIPLSSATSLAARTAREKRAEVMNNFSSARHASVFEGVPLGRKQGELIQKIISAPILDGTQICGVAQISRKGSTPSDSGADFTQKDLRVLSSLTPALGRFLKLCLVGT